MSERKWIPANEQDIGKVAMFFDFPGEDPVFGVLYDTDGSHVINGIKCCSVYWCDSGCEDDEPVPFNCCEVQQNDELTALQSQLEMYRKLYEHAIDRVDIVFQDEANRIAMLPDFLKLADDKFDGVVKLAVAYRQLQSRVAELEAERDAAIAEIGNRERVHAARIAELKAELRGILALIDAALRLLPPCNANQPDTDHPFG